MPDETPAETPAKRKPETTERRVLRRVDVTEFDDDEVDALGEAAAAGRLWVERGAAKGSKRQAVKAVVGDEVGTFRAPSLRSWKGRVEQAQAERPVQAKLVDD